MGRTCVSFVCTVLIASGFAASARAQAPDAIGVRAQGMGGAFTAVADDATATWWNPAGLATGAYFNSVLEYGRLTEPDQQRGGVAFAYPALGLSYYHLNVADAAPASTAAPAAGRQDPGALLVRAGDLSQFGATIGQSIGRYLVLGTTVKLMRAMGDTQAGLDVGVMAAAGSLRAGVTVRNLREPNFGSGDSAITLHRQARAGAALIVAGTGRGFGGLTVSVDADLRRVVTAIGDERRVAVGGELWVWNRAIGLRTGVSTSTIGDSRTSPSAGISVPFRRGAFLEGQVTGGSDATRKGWETGLRVTF